MDDTIKPVPLIAAYIGSFRGFTFGHEEVVAKLARKFSKVIVGIGINPDKSAEFSLAELEKNTREICDKYPNVEVVSFDGLFNDFLDEQKVDVLVRGLRNGAELDVQAVQDEYDDSEQEIELEENGECNSDRITFYLRSSSKKKFISSSLVKNLLKENGFPNRYAPASTIAQLQGRLFHKYPYAVTGVSGAGKSTICRKFETLAKELCIPLHHEDMDKIAHDILSAREERAYVSLRKRIVETFTPLAEKGVSLWNADGQTINRSELGKVLFADTEAMASYNRMMRPHLLRRLKKNLKPHQGIQLLDSALLAEASLTHISNHHVMVVDADIDTRVVRLKDRQGLSEDQVKRRAESQYTTEKKVEYVSEAMEKANYGSMQFLTNDDKVSDEKVREAFFNMLEAVDIFGELRITGFLKRSGTLEPAAAYQDLRLLYSEPDRRYHSLSHIVDGLNMMRYFQDKIENPEAFMLGWLFHDCVYNSKTLAETKPKSNEEQSAETMVKMATGCGFDAPTIEQAKNLILQTQIDRMSPKTNDEKLFVDLDMSILGRDETTFERYERELRVEHGTFTEAAWTEGRIRFLRSLDTENLYHTPFFRERFGSRAKQNIEGSLDRLARKSAAASVCCEASAPAIRAAL